MCADASVTYASGCAAARRRAHAGLFSETGCLLLIIESRATAPAPL